LGNLALPVARWPSNISMPFQYISNVMFLHLLLIRGTLGSLISNLICWLGF
jgi:hypothetical protein